MKTIFKIIILMFLYCAHKAFAAGIPTVDIVSNIQQGKALAESIAQTKKQIDQYKNQLEQYEVMVKNAKNLAQGDFVWSKAKQTITDLKRATDTLNKQKQEFGSINEYLKTYHDTNYYKQSCINKGGCSKEELLALEESNFKNIAHQKQANDALIQGLDAQQKNLDSEAERLESLQNQAVGAEGQLAAIQAANQFASNQTSQLMQIRSLLIAEQTAAATRRASLADIEAMRAAGDKKFRAGTFVKSPESTW